jgi:hypothetical protein
MVAPSFEIAGWVTAGFARLYLLETIHALLVPDGHPMLSSELVNDPFTTESSEAAVLPRMN